MRRDLIIAALAMVTVAVMISACTQLSGSGPTIESVATDKDLYHSNEVMQITIVVESPGAASNASVVINGIQDINGRNRLDLNMTTSLLRGPNTLTYPYQLPSCSHCAGLDPGDYQFNVTVLENGMSSKKVNHTVRIEQ